MLAVPAGTGIFNLTVDHSGRARHQGGMETPVPPPPDPALDAIFAALADGTRRAILTMLLEDDMAVTDVAEPFTMSLAAVSKHLAVLAEAGLIQQERRGRVKCCKLDPDAMRRAVVWIQGFGQVEPLDFDAFERFLEAELGEAADQTPRT